MCRINALYPARPLLKSRGVHLSDVIVNHSGGGEVRGSDCGALQNMTLKTVKTHHSIVSVCAVNADL